MSLTDTKVKNAKPRPDGRPEKLADGQGLYLLVKPNGARLWRLKYRLGGKEHLYSIGAYPEVTLAGARAERTHARELIGKGVHPRADRELQRLKQLHEGADTFSGIANEWIASNSQWRPYYLKQVRRGMDADVFPVVGQLPIRQVTPLHVRVLLAKVVARGAEVVAENLRRWMSAVFRYAIVHGRADVDHAAALKGVVKRPPIKHNVSLTPPQIADLLVRLEQSGGNRTTKIAIDLLLLTFVRTGELRQAKWDEFDLDVAKVWRVSGDTTN